MAALSYALLPLTGLAAYFLAGERRVRFHGLQAVVLGLLWPAGLYLCNALSLVATQLVFVVGALVWVAMMAATAAGADPRLPVIGGVLWRAAETRPGENPPTASARSTSGTRSRSTR